VSLAYHCDRNGCGSWQKASAVVPTEFYILLKGDDVKGHWCSLDCVMHWSAQHSAPTETINLDQEE
jgi:hypothetical protein